MKRTLLRWQLRCVVRHRRMLVDAALALVVDVRRWLRHGHRSDEDRFLLLGERACGRLVWWEARRW